MWETLSYGSIAGKVHNICWAGDASPWLSHLSGTLQHMLNFPGIAVEVKRVLSVKMDQDLIPPKVKDCGSPTVHPKSPSFSPRLLPWHLGKTPGCWDLGLCCQIQCKLISYFSFPTRALVRMHHRISPLVGAQAPAAFGDQSKDAPLRR